MGTERVGALLGTFWNPAPERPVLAAPRLLARFSTLLLL